MARRAGFDALLALCAGVSLAFLAIPSVALFTQVPLHRLPSLLGSGQVRDAIWVTVRTNAIANALVLGFGTPAAYLLATRRFRGRSVVVTLVELPVVLPPPLAGTALLSAFGRGGLLGDALASGAVDLPFTLSGVVVRVRSAPAPVCLPAP